MPTAFIYLIIGFSFKYWFLQLNNERQIYTQKRNMTRSKNEVAQESEKDILCNPGRLPGGVGLEVGPEKGLVLDKWVKQQASSQEGEVS